MNIEHPTSNIQRRMGLSAYSDQLKRAGTRPAPTRLWTDFLLTPYCLLPGLQPCVPSPGVLFNTDRHKACPYRHLDLSLLLTPYSLLSSVLWANTQVRPYGLIARFLILRHLVFPYSLLLTPYCLLPWFLAIRPLTHCPLFSGPLTRAQPGTTAAYREWLWLCRTGRR